MWRCRAATSASTSPRIAHARAAAAAAAASVAEAAAAAMAAAEAVAAAAAIFDASTHLSASRAGGRRTRAQPAWPGRSAVKTCRKEAGPGLRDTPPGQAGFRGGARQRLGCSDTPLLR